jgi:hypothetical protein
MSGFLTDGKTDGDPRIVGKQEVISLAKRKKEEYKERIIPNFLLAISQKKTFFGKLMGVT